MIDLKSFGILGNNNRIASYILPHNKRSSYPYVDDKLKTAKLLESSGLQSPKLYSKIEKMSDTKNLHERLKGLNDFVIKPARGSMGNGITIVNELKWNQKESETHFLTSNKKSMDYSAFIYQVSSILSGLYSLNGQPDRVLIQQKLKVHPFFNDLIYKGVPDVRIILFKGVPVMAMLRLPTLISRGKGNLHQGAVGCGVELSSGKITKAIQRNRFIKKHPDTDQDFKGLKIPYWEESLRLAVNSAELVDIGYLGVDIVIQPDSGPIILEMNARPGLSIQLANQSGLLPRLELVESKVDELKSIDSKINFSVENF